MATRQQLEQQLVAAHRTGNVQAAQQAAYAIRQYDQSALSAQVPSINAPPPIDRLPKPTFGSWLGNVTTGIGEGLGEQVQGIGGAIQRGVTAFAQDPLKASAAAFMTALEPARQGFTQPVQAYKDVGTGIVETGKQMYQQATSGPIGLGTVIGQNIDIMPGPNLPGGKRRPTMAELDVYHGTPYTFDPETGAPLGRFRSEKIGTGEGAQAYGYGLYLAESPNVAEDYAKVLASPRNRVMDRQGVYIEPSPMGDGTYRLGKMSETGKMRGTIGDAIQGITDFKYPNIAAAIRDAKKLGYLPKKGKPLLNAIGEDGKYVPVRRASDVTEEKFGYGPEYAQFIASEPGRVYKVDLPDAKIEQMLDWDKPLSEQSAAVKEALRKSPFAPDESVWDKWTGQQLYESEVRAMTDFDKLPKGSSRAFVSNALRQAGIPGIKYLDAGSRDGGKGTRNFVVFPGEEQHLTILERDGVKAEVPKAAAPKVRQFSPASLASVKVGGKVDGYTVRADVPNTDSIGATLDDYEVLSGIRSVPMSDFDPEYVRSISMDKLDARTRRLADEIQQSKELSPMIVAYDAEGPYIIEGGHRFDALIASKAKSIPAVVVIDKSNPPK